MSEPAPGQAEINGNGAGRCCASCWISMMPKTLASQLMAHGEATGGPAIIKTYHQRAGRASPERQRVSLSANITSASFPPPIPLCLPLCIDLFAGIRGIRHGFEAIGGRCVFTSEWNKHAVRTYKANWYCDPDAHQFNADIRDVTLSHKAA